MLDYGWQKGDNKTCREITFTNNCVQLVKLFEETIQKTFPEERLKSRVYAYSPKLEKVDAPFESKVKQYIDTQARKPYYIYRISKTSITKRWKELVEKQCLTKEAYVDILQGFFAGEGNVKFHKNSHSRTIRIAQKTRKKFLEIILDYIGVKSRFSSVERAYVITGRWNLDKLAKIEIAALHPDKNKKFREMFSTYKQHHYPRNFFKNKIYGALKNPYTSHQFALLFNRSLAHAQETLIMLKNEGKVQKFKIGSDFYWIRIDQNTVLISEARGEYLKLLIKYGHSNTALLAKERDVCFRCADKALKSMEKLGLVRRGQNKKWRLCTPNKKVVQMHRMGSLDLMRRVEY